MAAIVDYLPFRVSERSHESMARDSLAVSIFHYLDYHRYLRDWFEAAKQKNPRFSLRVFASRAGFRSHNALKMVMQGNRNLTAESALRCARGLRLGRRESEYFSLLVAYVASKDEQERAAVLKKLRQFQEVSQIRSLTPDQFSYYSTWYHAVIRELAVHQDFSGSPKWIAEHLSPQVTVSEVTQSLELLERLGLLKKMSGGKYKQVDKLLTTGPEITSPAVTQYHLAVLDLAKAAIDRIPREKREVSSLTLAVSEAMLPTLKRRIQLFQEEIMRFVSTEKETDVVMQLNFQLFPLTRTHKEHHA